ncbi:MAG: hypothetical protein RL020_665, partial [Pseudomonadota bacterium]
MSRQIILFIVLLALAAVAPLAGL